MELNKNRFNKGTEYGRGVIEHSLQELGCGRSVLADKNGVIVAGNDVYHSAIQLGKKIKVVEIDGDTLVVVKRVDLDADSKKGKEMALIDNLAQEKNLQWNADMLLHSMQEELSFDPRKWGGEQCLVQELDINDFLKDDVQPIEKKEKENASFMPVTQMSLFD